MKLGLTRYYFKISIIPHPEFHLNYFFLSGVFLYSISFLIWLYILQRTTIDFAYPISIGVTQLFIFSASTIILHQKLNAMIITGSLFITLGITFMLLSK